jgi:hypothetical protein
MNKITPIALIVAGGLSSAANAAIVVQDFNVLPSDTGVDITIGGASGPQYVYSHIVKPIPVDPGFIQLTSLGGNSASSMFANVSGPHTLPTASDSFSSAAYKPNGAGGDYIGLKFQIGTGTHVGIAHFGEANELGLIPLVDVEYDDVALAGAVPEPESWALLIGGLGVVGAAARRSRRRQAAVTA